MKFILLLLLLSFSTPAISQSNSTKKDTLIAKFNSIPVDSVWKIIRTKDQLSFVLSDTFTVCRDLSPLRRNGFINTDTLTLKINFEEGWTEYKKDSIASRNSEILDLISEKVISTTTVSDGE